MGEEGATRSRTEQTSLFVAYGHALTAFLNIIHASVFSTMDIDVETHFLVECGRLLHATFSWIFVLAGRDLNMSIEALSMGWTRAAGA